MHTQSTINLPLPSHLSRSKNTVNGKAFHHPRSRFLQNRRHFFESPGSRNPVINSGAVTVMTKRHPGEFCDVDASTTTTTMTHIITEITTCIRRSLFLNRVKRRPFRVLPSGSEISSTPTYTTPDL